MSVKSMGYDHAAYLAVYRQPVLSVAGALITGSATNSQKYSAFTTLVLKSITTYASVLTTSIDTPLLFLRVTGNGTTAVNTVTATYTMSTPLGSAAYFANSVLNTASAISTSGATTVALTDGLGHPIVTQGDLWFIQKGTDATGTVGYDAELAILPLSNVTV